MDTLHKRLFALMGSVLLVFGFVYYYRVAYGVDPFSLPTAHLSVAVLLISLAAFAATFLGGLLALRFKDRLHLIIGFSAGAVIGVAFFDLIPEALELTKAAYAPSVITSVMAFGFVMYLIFDRYISIHCHATGEVCEGHSHRGLLGAGSLSVHSFLDGVAIGLAFQVSAAVGAVVAVAVLVHDFSDGLNTVNMIIRNHGDRQQALKWLLIDAAAPMLGVISTLFFTLPESALGIILALFSGFFLYIGASDLLPESHHNHPTWWTTFTTILGILVLYFAIQLAGV